MAISETPGSHRAQPVPSLPGSDVASQCDAVLHIRKDATLPGHWRTPWLDAGWTIVSDEAAAGLAQLAIPTDARYLLVSVRSADHEVAPFPAEIHPASGYDVGFSLEVAAPLPSSRGGGTLRRGDFIGRLSALMETPANDDWVLLAIRVDQMAQLASLNALAIVALEEQVLARMVALLHPDGVSTVWMEFGFGMLVRRQERAQIEEFATRLCIAVAGAPFQAEEAPVSLTVSIGIALSPRDRIADGGQRWFAIAHAAQAIAFRHGGNRFEGVLSRIYEPMPPERVLIVREWLDEAKSGSNVVAEYQPVIPLHAGATPLYAVQAKLRDHRDPLGGVYRDEFRLLAIEAGGLAMIDRLGLFAAFEALEQERARGRRTALLAPIDPATLAGTPWRWLQAELGRRTALAGGLILELEATSQLPEADVLEQLRTLRSLGVRIALSDRSGGLESIEAWSTAPIDLLRLPSTVLDAIPLQDFLERTARWNGQGRQIFVDGVAGSGAIARYAGYRVDYLAGHGLAATGPRLDYDFG